MDWSLLEIKGFSQWMLTWGLLVVPLFSIVSSLWSNKLGAQIGPWSIILSPLFYIPLMFVFFGNYHWIVKGLLGLLSTVVMIVLNAIQDGEDENLQMARDKNALALKDKYLSLIAEDKAFTFSLYLRPFDSTNILQSQTAGDGRSGGHLTLDLETLIERIMRKESPLIALGKPGEMIGAGRILTTEEKWKSEIETLIKKSALIFILPSDHPGTLYEIQRIRNCRLFEKCIWIMPESVSETGFHASISTGVPRFKSEIKYSDFSELWKRTKTIVESNEKILLPDYNYKGMFFKMDESGNMIKTATLSLSKKFNKIGVVKNAIQEMTKQ